MYSTYVDVLLFYQYMRYTLSILWTSISSTNRTNQPRADPQVQPALGLPGEMELLPSPKPCAILQHGLYRQAHTRPDQGTSARNAWLCLGMMDVAELRILGGIVLAQAQTPGQRERVVSMRELLEAGVHFGHQTRRWNPKMRPYIFTERNGIHIIDLQQTIPAVQAAYDFIADLTSRGGKVLFVGTKKQAQDIVAEEATRSNQYYVTNRWLGGTLTNFQTIRERLNHLADLEVRRDRGDFAKLTKAEGLRLEDEITKLNRTFGGIKTMDRRPGALFIVDPAREELAVAEARKLNLPIVAMVDTNCNPEMIDYVIPANDDAIRGVRVIVSKMADAAIEGQQRRQSRHEGATNDAV